MLLSLLQTIFFNTSDLLSPIYLYKNFRIKNIDI